MLNTLSKSTFKYWPIEVAMQSCLMIKGENVLFRNKFSLSRPLRVREHNVEQTLDFSEDKLSPTGAVAQIWIKIQVKIQI